MNSTLYENAEEKDIKDIETFTEVYFYVAKKMWYLFIYFLIPLFPKFSAGIHHSHNQKKNQYFLRDQMNLRMVWKNLIKVGVE